MTPATILYVGDDVCQRIPVLERNGFRVVRAHDSGYAVRHLLTNLPNLAAIMFHCDIDPLPDELVRMIRSISSAPLIFFENPCSCSAQTDFDLVIPVLTSPNIWLDKLTQVIGSRAIA